METFVLRRVRLTTPLFIPLVSFAREIHPGECRKPAHRTAIERLR